MIFRVPNICPAFAVFLVLTFAVVFASMLEEQNVGLRGKRLVLAEGMMIESRR